MKIVGKTDIGRNRAENQDTFRSGCVPGVGAWGIVCDGMGGAQHGRLASAVAADCMEEMLYQQMRDETPPADIQHMLNSAIQLANDEVYARSGNGEELMGTTVVCAYLAGGRLYLAHVGDSRAYLFSGGELLQLTRDHSMVQELVDMGTITRAQAARHPERNVITRALGVEEDVEPSFASYSVKPKDVVLLCTDGLTGMVSADAIGDIMELADFFDMPRLLVEAALQGGGEDNVTVLVMRVDEQDVPEAKKKDAK